jgi:hypothetical protein
MPEIAAYGFGHVTIDGREETRDVIVLPDRVVRDWWRKDGHGLVLEDLDDVLEDLPEHLLLGTGAHGQLRPDPGTLEALRARGIDVEVLPDGGGGRALRAARPAKDRRSAPPDVLTVR